MVILDLYSGEHIWVDGNRSRSCRVKNTVKDVWVPIWGTHTRKDLPTYVVGQEVKTISSSPIHEHERTLLSEMICNRWPTGGHLTEEFNGFSVQSQSAPRWEQFPERLRRISIQLYGYQY